jgi:hypothetical protein
VRRNFQKLDIFFTNKQRKKETTKERKKERNNQRKKETLKQTNEPNN